jgi:hypothetical protein
MLKQAETLWADSQSQPRPIFESPPDRRDRARFGPFFQRAATLAAAIAVVAYVLYAFWLRAVPPLLFGPLGPVDAIHEGGNDALWNTDFSARTDGLPRALDSHIGQTGAGSKATSRTGATF